MLSITDTSGEQETSDFSLAEARRIVGDFFTPNPWIYWPDFLGSMALGAIAFWLVLHPQIATDNSFWRIDSLSTTSWWHVPLGAACFVISSLAYYRASLFIHELVHIRSSEFTAFRFAWNVLCGIPFLIPSFVYYTHIDHHRRKHYGTHDDGEYIPLANLPAWQILFYLSQSLVIPLIAIVRWGVLTPLTWISPRVRDWVHQHMSSMIMDPKYIRPLPSKRVLRMMRLQELGCFLFIWGMAFKLFTGIGLTKLDISPLMLVQFYFTGVFVLVINSLRTLGAHRWTNVEGREMTFIEQLLDSVNYPHNPLIAGLWAPVGLRFHALHHVFPTMPYHALAKAHKRLMQDLPADSPYRKTEARSLTESMAILWNRARKNNLRQT